MTATVSGIRYGTSLGSVRQDWIGAGERLAVIDDYDWHSPGLDFHAANRQPVGMRLYCFLLIFCFACVGLSADETPLPLGAADLATDARLEAFKTHTLTSQLEVAFQTEALKQLDLKYELDPPSDLEVLQHENAQLKLRVAELERRLAIVEAKLSETEGE
ncbi:hypothetical protein QEH59_12250 [Coraliomargarita sp. SDUM461004]|uniref:YbgF trimerisation domain-containing protein n=1 Tax=Thalassobacterium sedimentorum TaxID=3041258 RepID=A0ABU1AN58_9BACT|nr:hypothetical protein [Coraliomargarita sp. SDUM461004]MDQ8195201.1 hypothetical protein [Coraliomargarita sp. SDUM461004]